MLEDVLKCFGVTFALITASEKEDDGDARLRGDHFLHQAVSRISRQDDRPLDIFSILMEVLSSKLRINDEGSWREHVMLVKKLRRRPGLAARLPQL